MTQQEFDSARAVLEEACKNLLVRKGRDYTDGGDRLSNFKTEALSLGVTPYQIWAVYFLKHIAAIMTFVRTGDVASEPVSGRIMDARNYLDLFWALYQEQCKCGSGKE